MLTLIGIRFVGHLVRSATGLLHALEPTVKQYVSKYDDLGRR
jgi:hypothetical protein